MNQETRRKAFEKWYSKETGWTSRQFDFYWDYNTSGYSDRDFQVSWLAWNAALDCVYKS